MRFVAAENTTTNVSETQLVQMARQEEAILAQKHGLLEKISALLTESITAKETLEEIIKTKGKMFIGVGATVLVEVQVTDTENCKRAFTESGYKDEKIKGTIEWLAKKEEMLKKQFEKISREYAEAEGRMVQITGILKQIQAEKKKMYENSKKQPPTISK